MSEDFKIWWHNEGSGMPPLKDEETCDHVERVSAIAWSNGAFKATLSLEAENARLKADVNELADGLKLASEIGIKIADEVTRLKAEVERLRKAGDAMAEAFDLKYPVAGGLINAWNAAKEGNGQP